MSDYECYQLLLITNMSKISTATTVKKVLLTAVISYCSAEYLFYRLYPPAQPPPGNVQHSWDRHAPITSPFRTIAYPHFTILYSTYHKSPLAVHELITRQIAEGDAPRARFFLPDEQIQPKHFQVDNSYFADTQAYKRFDLNRGHMAAAGNYSADEAEKFHTFTFANIIPQNGTNNGGIWNTFERYARNLAISQICESVQSISGPIYPKNSPYTKQSNDTSQKNYNSFVSTLKVLKQDGIPIPEKLYKIIKCNAKNGSYFSAYEFLNEQTYDNHRKLNQFQVPLQTIEQQTGLKFNVTGSPLRELDTSTLEKTKKEIDYPFYFGLMANATKLSEMGDGLRRAGSQKIEIQLSDLSQKIRQLTQKEFGQIKAGLGSHCDKLTKMLRLGRKIAHLKHLQQTNDLREEGVRDSYLECVKIPNQYKSLMEDFKQQIAKLEAAFNLRKGKQPS